MEIGIMFLGPLVTKHDNQIMKSEFSTEATLSQYTKQSSPSLQITSPKITEMKHTHLCNLAGNKMFLLICVLQSSGTSI